MGYNDFARLFFNHVVATYHINRDVSTNIVMMLMQNADIIILSRVVISLKRLFFICLV